MSVLCRLRGRGRGESTTGGTSLRYDATAGQLIANRKTPTTASCCYAVTVKTVDGTTVGPAYF